MSDNKNKKLRTKVVNFRLSIEVYDEWTKKAQIEGMSFSDYVRSCVDAKEVTKIASSKKKSRRAAFSKVDPELLREIAKIGNNINQIARWINTHKKGVEAFLLTAHLSAIQRELEKLLSDQALGASHAD